MIFDFRKHGFPAPVDLRKEVKPDETRKKSRESESEAQIRRVSTQKKNSIEQKEAA